MWEQVCNLLDFGKLQTCRHLVVAGRVETPLLSEHKNRSRWAALLAGWSFKNYGWTALRRDVLAGLTVATVAVPQAMAYALIAGIEPIYGLYTAIVMTALASIFGSSPHLINGPTNAISLVVFSAIASAAERPEERIAIVCLLAVLVGLIQIIIALLKLGDLTGYIPESVVL